MTKLDRTFALAGDGDPLGLLCSPQGLSLAGAPLLKCGVAGLAPRPEDDIAALMKAAYGEAKGPDGLTAGLRVVADALNGKDIARAMVAAIQLRLPPLDWNAGERIARAEAMLAKYDVGELRNELGRWTTGGASASPQSANPPGTSRVATPKAGADPFSAGGKHDPLDAKVLRYLASRANDWRYSVSPKTGALLFEGRPQDAAATQAWKEKQLSAPSGRLGVVSEQERQLRDSLSRMSAAQAEVATYPHALDAKVEAYVNQYNQSKGFKPGDREYLDPDLIRAMIMQESAHDLKAFNSDPMQVNVGDWDKAKTKLGLIQGAPPGQNLSVSAGIQWLIFKSYHHGDDGRPDRFRGWYAGVADYNYAGRTAYADSVFRHLAIIKQAEVDRSF